MLNLALKYPGQVEAPSSEYLWGSARNVSTPGDGTGTPYDKDLVNDTVGFYQALVADVGDAPNNVSERIGNSQLLAAIRKTTVRTYPSTAEMTADPNAQVGAVVRTEEFVAGEGGAGVYDVVATSSVTPNGRDIIESTASGATWSFVLRITFPQDPAAFGNDAGGLARACARCPWVEVTRDDLILTASVQCTSPVRLTGAPGHRIIPRIGLVGGKVFEFLANDVHVMGLNVDATGETFTPATGNTYIFFGGDGVTAYKRHTYRDNQIRAASFSDGNTGDTNLLVTHGIYVDKVDAVDISDNMFDGISGACIFTRRIHGMAIRDNTFKDARWYNVQLDYDVRRWAIHNNRFLSGTAEGTYWGGAVNIVSDVTGAIQVTRGVISDNFFTGTYSYGAVIRLQSGKGIVVENNELADVTNGTATSGDLSGIRVLTRGTGPSDKNEPCSQITVRNNVLYGPTGVAGRRRGIFVDNAYWSTRNPAKEIRVYGNTLLSPDGTHYWDEGITFHGLSGGIEDVWVYSNRVEVLTQASPVVGGAIGFLGDSADGAVDRVWIGGNTLVDIGTPTASYQYGIGIGAYTTNVWNTAVNAIDNFFYGVRTFPNSGPILDKLDDQFFINTTTSLLEGTPLSRYGVYLENTVVWDPGNIVDGSQTFTDVTVTGAALGDLVQVSFDVTQVELILTGYVRTAGSVRCVLSNLTGAAQNLASGNLRVRVLK
jgi:hypothetical protein